MLILNSRKFETNIKIPGVLPAIPSEFFCDFFYYLGIAFIKYFMDKKRREV